MSGSLAGVKVLDFTQMMAGPLCSMVLGDMGATVVKVEPEEGDAMRHISHKHFGMSENFIALNRNKRSLVLDLKDPSCTPIIHELVRDADVVLENFRPGVAEKLGLGWDELREINPRLVYCSVSGFGEKSKLANKPALDPVIQALSGMLDLNGTKATGPLVVNIPFADYNTPLIAVIGILGAINARHATGKGQRIEVDMFKSTIFGMKPRTEYTMTRGAYPTRDGNANPQLSPCGTYPTRDGRSIFIIVHNDKFWQGLRRVLGVEALSDEAKFGTMDLRVKNRAELDKLMSDRMLQDDLAHWEHAFAADNVVFGTVNTLEEALNLPEVRDTMIHEAEVGGGKVPVVGIPIFYSDTPNDVRFPPPELGEANDEILRAGGAKWPA
ncbi:MAG: CaiB/BaiF CoA transferase family protein [Flavobacteriaceae bacterium]